MKSLRNPPLRQLIDLTGKTAIVTGGAMGIGRAIVDRLAEAGASILIADMDEEAAYAAAKQIEAAGGRARAFRADVSKTGEGDIIVREALTAFGTVDILVNNAGVYPMKPVLEIDERTWDKTIGVNLKGSFLFAQAAARQMVKQGRGGVILNIASVDGFHPSGNLVHYDASKGGVVMMTKALALELAKSRIRVVAIAPGGIRTEGVAKVTAGAVEQMKSAGMTPEQIVQAFTARVPLGRMGDPDDIAKVAAFLVSDLAGYMTGTTVVVDGGYLVG